MAMAADDSQLAQLSSLTTIVADTGEIEAMKKYKPEDATTNPSLLLKAVTKDEYKGLIGEAADESKKSCAPDADISTRIGDVMDRLAVTVGSQILKIVPGVVSTEVDARLSFDTAASVKKARHLISLYEKLGIGRERILIKLASTWEGIEAAKILEKEGIHCNMTLLFCLAQAVAAAHAGATLISPFVGRITDWHKKAKGVDGFDPKDDPGVASVHTIYNYYKTFGHKTIVMGASFRNKGQILQLVGCDKLTISPALLGELGECNDAAPRLLSPDNLPKGIDELSYDESSFRWALNEDPCATEKLAEGIRRFAADAVKLENLIKEHLTAES